MTPCSRDELMIVTAARALADRQRVFVGIGLPNVACNLARRLHAPDLELVYESGVVGARPERLPASIGDPTLVSGAASVCSLPEVFLYYLQGGLIDVGFLGAAQIDRYGNLNTTVIGPYDAPKVRLPGSGGACDIALLARQTIVIARQTPRLLVERVEFVTSPGHDRRPGKLRSGSLGSGSLGSDLDPCGGRPGSDLDPCVERFPASSSMQGSRSDPGTAQRSRSDPYGAGPQLLITDLAVYGFEGAPAELTVRSLHPGVTREEVAARIPWAIRLQDDLPVTPGPSDRDLAVLRQVRGAVVGSG
ncbi:MAG: CoA-transferase [Vicinamibacterales bacterium]|nr:CoA-transferase [Vicinamibacterales bacterium]